ncbi:MAG: hypothetical protein DBX59_12135 [Bacillota bacterium]|nr:MAG: hypothetical protein DBX59_12135 [Bacillota bacterium]
MYERRLDGVLFCRLLKGGYAALKRNAEEINDLNVFPIPDGDTGDNMCATMYGAVAAADGANGPLGETAERVSRGMLLGARGNSGVILSRLFAGIASRLQGTDTADIEELGAAVCEGVKYAYAAVSNPTEGTMLTVLRCAAKYAAEAIGEDSSLESYFSDFAKEAEAVLEQTPEMLPILKEAGRVDSGGAGIVCIADGMLKELRGENTAVGEEVAATVAPAGDVFSAFNENSVLQFGYCTEFLLQLTHAKTDIAAFSMAKFKAKLEKLGESIVAFQTGTVVKVHVHTMFPSRVLEYAQTFGEFLNLKIENMMIQHKEQIAPPDRTQSFKKNPVRKPFGVVAVADGAGMTSVFKELGADVVVDGGMGKNPSVECFLRAFDAVNAEHIFVLPNHCNIRLAAKEAAGMFGESDVRVLGSKNMGEGYVALSALDCATEDVDGIFEAMEAERKNAASGMVSRAHRTADFNERSVKKNDYVGIADKKIVTVCEDKIAAAAELTEKLGAGERDFVVVFYGKSVADFEKAAYKNAVRKLTDAEFYEMDGGQDVYDFIVVAQ